MRVASIFLGLGLLLSLAACEQELSVGEDNRDGGDSGTTPGDTTYQPFTAGTRGATIDEILGPKLVIGHLEVVDGVIHRSSSQLQR